MKHPQSLTIEAVSEATQSVRHSVSKFEGSIRYLQEQIAVQKELLKEREDPNKFRYVADKSRLEKDLRTGWRTWHLPVRVSMGKS